MSSKETLTDTFLAKMRALPLIGALPIWGKPPAEPALEEEIVCCGGQVHVAFRGVSDERLYLSKGRNWSEVRYFRPHGLRVFCAECRRRVL